jgi:hypothetical protein
MKSVEIERCFGKPRLKQKEQLAKTTRAVYTILRHIATLIPCEFPDVIIRKKGGADITSIFMPLLLVYGAELEE